MDLRTYLKVFRRRLLSISVCVLLGVAIALALSLSSRKVYTASTQLFVSSSTGADSSAQLAQANTFTQARVQSYVSLVTNAEVLQPVITQLGLKASNGRTIPVSTLAKQVSASAPANRVLLNVSVVWPDPTRAAEIANAVSTSFAAHIKKLETVTTTVPGVDGGAPQTTSSTPVNVTVSEQATVPGSPSSPKTRTNVVLGLVVGLVVGLGQAVLRELLDNTVKTGADVAAITGLPVMGWIPRDKRSNRNHIAFRDDTHGLRAEAFRQVRANLQFVDIDNPPKVIAVTSALPGEGKSSTALNLAASLAEAGARVCLIDADLRRPTVAEALGLVGNVGFTSVLIGQAEVVDVLQNAGENLAVLTSGPVPPNPSELLVTEHAKQVVATLADEVDYIIIDTAPLLPVIDGALVAAIADVTLMVVRAGKSTKDQLARGIDVLQQVGERPVGVVLNMIPRAGGSGGDSYGYYYGSYEPKLEKSAGSAGSSASASEAAASAHAADDLPHRREFEELGIDTRSDARSRA